MLEKGWKAGEVLNLQDGLDRLLLEEAGKIKVMLPALLEKC